jgi:hypothetical protein
VASGVFSMDNYNAFWHFKAKFIVIETEDPEQRERKRSLNYQERKHVPKIYNELKKGKNTN